MASLKRSPPKKAKLTDDFIASIAKGAAEIELQWNNIAPVYFTEWLEEFSLAHNVVKELMLMAILPSIAVLLGSRSFVKPSAQEPYTENFSLFSLCISPPLSGKSQAFKHGVKIPLTYVEKENANAPILLDKFTEAGLRQHLIQHKGVAAILGDEMYDTLRSIISERDVGTLCRLYDGDSITCNIGNNTSRVSTEETCVSLGGFIQVKNFFSEIYPCMASSKNGFEQRFLYSVVKPTAMTRKESERYVLKLQESNLKDLSEIYDAVYRDHTEGVTYTFSEDALALYDDFDAEICKMLNSKWKMGVLMPDDAEIGKDRRQVVRLAVILYVLYTYTRRAILQCYGTISRVIGKTFVQYAIELMKYFRAQKKAIDKILDPSNMTCLGGNHQLEKKILEHAGPVVHMHTIRSKYNASTRPAKDDVADAMSHLEEEGLGVFVNSGTAMAFLKQVPSAVEEAKLQQYNVSERSYQAAFGRKNFDLPSQLRDHLLSKDPLGKVINEYLVQQKENTQD